MELEYLPSLPRHSQSNTVTRGNIITMKRRLESRGISVNVDECSIGQPL